MKLREKLFGNTCDKYEKKIVKDTHLEVKAI